MYKESIQIYRIPSARVTVIVSTKVLKRDSNRIYYINELILEDSSFTTWVDA